jgi:oligopeptide/dipeptide ABC transporter ATP-binding protein
MQDIQQEFGLSYVFLSHDLSVVRHVSDRIFVMYLGSIVETGPADAIYRHPAHPYSQILLAAVPRPDPEARRLRARKSADAVAATRPTADDMPSPLNKPSGCAFRTRCPIARPDCADSVPPLVEREGRLVACPYAT